MKKLKTKINAIIILILTMLLINCVDKQNKNNKQSFDTKTNQQFIQIAERIKIDELKNALIKLKNGQTEYKFIGITSNGTDCIYFVYENGKFNLEFEAITEMQIPYIDKLKNFAKSNNFKSILTTYNNKPQFESKKPAPVIRIETNTNLNKTIDLAKRIQSEIFKNNNETIYDIVP